MYCSESSGFTRHFRHNATTSVKNFLRSEEKLLSARDSTLLVVDVASSCQVHNESWWKEGLGLRSCRLLVHNNVSKPALRECKLLSSCLPYHLPVLVVYVVSVRSSRSSIRVFQGSKLIRSTASHLLTELRHVLRC